MKTKNILVIGGAGYVGSVLIPKLLAEGHRVTVLDLYAFGKEVFDGVREKYATLREICGDMRDKKTLERSFEGVDTLIHLACISNDASFDLDPQLGKSINYDSIFDVIEQVKENKLDQFIYVSSAAVYGVKGPEVDITEEVDLNPQTDYARFKVMSEEAIWQDGIQGVTTTVIRCGTICGYSPRLRLDVVVNLFTNQAFNRGKLSVFNGDQVRPHLHVEDIADFYCLLMKAPKEKIDGETFNIAAEYCTIASLGDSVREVVERKTGQSVAVEMVNSPDNRSCRLNSEKMGRTLGFKPKYLVRDAISDLVDHFQSGDIPNALEDIRYYNVKTMKAIGLK